MCTAGRTVLFSAVTVALSLSALVIFPMYFLKSFAYAGIATVAFAAAAAVIATPAAIMVLGARLDSFDMRRLVRRVLRRSEPEPTPIQRQFWYRSTKAVMRRAIPVGTAIVALLVLLGLPSPISSSATPRPGATQDCVGAPGRRPVAQRLRQQSLLRDEHRPPGCRRRQSGRT